MMNNRVLVYFENNEYLKRVAFQPHSSPHRCVAGRPLMDDVPSDKGACPHIFITKDQEVIDRLKRIDDLEKFFINAIVFESPVLQAHRECGIYYFGLAKAELTKQVEIHLKKKSFENEATYNLKVETASIHGFKDLFELRRLIWEGDSSLEISKSYEKESSITEKSSLS